VNEYLREITKENFSAKDFRTWSGTVIATEVLKELGEAETQTQAKKHITEAINKASQYLGNTPTICRKCYVHPDVLDAYLHGTFLKILQEQEARRQQKEFAGLHPHFHAAWQYALVLSRERSQVIRGL
jgi:DNA topoisomerase-1